MTLQSLHLIMVRLAVFVNQFWPVAFGSFEIGYEFLTLYCQLFQFHFLFFQFRPEMLFSKPIASLEGLPLYGTALFAHTRRDISA